MWIETEMLEQEVKKLKAQMWKINKRLKLRKKEIKLQEISEMTTKQFQN